MMTINAIFESPSAGDVRGALDVQYGADGEAYNTHTAATGARDETIVANTLDDLGAALAIGGAATGDFVQCQFLRYGTHVNDTITDTLYFVGFLVSYTADM
jgi:hypothetical protein